MADDQKTTEHSEDLERRVAFDYIKGANFRIVRADGAIGGITPPGQIHFALYSERHPIPRRLVHTLDDEGKLSAPIKSETVSRDAIVREVEVDVFLNIEAAKGLYDWLGSKIDEWHERHDSGIAMIQEESE